MDLSGTWRAAPADEQLRRVFPDEGFDDGGWEQLEVPGHWRAAPAFAGHDGPVLHRRRFEYEPAADHTRVWLVVEGVFYQSDVWLDGSYVGDTEGYFFPHAFDVTAASRERREHTLAIEAACSPVRDPAARRNLTGAFQRWAAIDRDWNPGGIWRPVRVEETGPVRIARLRVLCTDATPARATLRLRAVLDSAGAETVVLRTAVAGIDDLRDQRLARGENRIGWDITVERPDLWWPHAMGDQPLHDLTVEVSGAGGAPSHGVARRVGLREVRLRNWVLRVNGERLFVKGTSVGPTRPDIAYATRDEVEGDVALARDAGLDLVRVRAHVARPELYDAADRLGMLVWQDLPVVGRHARGIRKQAARQAREAVDLLGHHASIVAWCGHDAPGDADDWREPQRLALLQQLPSWNRSLLDRTLRRALERADHSRAVVPHSGVLPHVGSGGTDAHWWFGWHYGDVDGLTRLAAVMPRLVRFVGAFGAQAVPANATFAHAEAWPDLDWDRLATAHALDVESMRRAVPPENHASFQSWQEATQAHQAAVLKRTVETLRRLKYRPTGGFCHFLLADSQPAISWSVLDHERSAKPGYEALAAACAPVIVVADAPAASYAPGDTVALDVHVVNDLRVPLPEAVVRARLRAGGDTYQWEWAGSVPADGCVRVNTIAAVVPDIEGSLEVDLELDAGAVKATNAYASRISRPQPGDARMPS